MRAYILFFLCFSTLGFSEEARKKVYVDIVGDLFHAGHVEFLKNARSFGDYLIVGVLADDVVEGYKRVPVISLEERAKVIAACKYVDEVILAPPVCLTEEMLKEMNIQYVVHGDDLRPELEQEHYGPAIRLGLYRTVPYTQGISTTEIIERLTNRCNRGEF